MPIGPKPRKYIGLSAIRAIRVFHKKYGTRLFMILVDKEHLSENIEKEFKKYNLLPTSISRVIERVMLVESSMNSTKVLIIIAINGEKKNIEEDRSRFIFYKYGDIVPPDKRNIKRYYRERGLNEIDEIKKAELNIIQKAFPGIVHGLRLLEKLLKKMKPNIEMG